MSRSYRVMQAMMLQDMCLPVIVAKFTIWSDGDHIKDEISGQKNSHAA